MQRFCWVLSLLVLFLNASDIDAQNPKRNYEGPGNWFFGIQMGTSHAMNENVNYDNFFHTEMPSVSLQVGRTLTPRWSIRATGAVSSQLGHASEQAVKYKPSMFGDYNFYAAVTTADVMLNLTNCCRKYNTRNWFDLYTVLGGGGLFRFNVDEKVRYWYTDVYPVEANNYWFWTAKLGLEGAWHTSRGWDVVAEIDLHVTADAYNGVSASSRFWDPFLVLQIGVVHYFHNSYRRQRFANARAMHRFWKELN